MPPKSPTSTFQGVVTRSVNKINAVTLKINEYIGKKEKSDPLTAIETATFKANLASLKHNADIIHEYLQKWEDFISEEDDDTEQGKLQEVFDAYHNKTKPREIALDAQELAVTSETVSLSLDESQAETAKPISSNKGQHQSLSHDLPKLAPIQIPTFDGKRSNWFEFKDQFLALVDSRPCDEVYKLLQLKTALLGVPGELIRDLSTTKDNYSIAWDILKSHYEQPNELQIALTQELSDLKPANNSSQEARRVVNSLNRISAQMEKAKITELDPFLKNAFIRLLPQWLTEKVMDRKSSGTAKELITEADQILNQKEFLNHYRTEPSRLQDNTSTHNSFKNKIHTPHQNKSWLQPKEAVQKPASPCAFCSGDHFHAQCSNYATSEARNKRAAQLSLCRKCLSNKHQIANCSRNSTCSHCGANNHHSTLCNPNNFKIQQKPNSRHSQNVSKAVAAVADYSTLADSTQAESSIVMSKTIEVFTKAAGVKSIFALIDFGSEYSFIKSDLAKRLGLNLEILQPMKVQGFNGKCSNLSSHKTSINILTIDDKVFSAPVCTVDKIVDNLRTIDGYPEDIAKLQEFDVEKYLAYKEPEILLGANVLRQLNHQNLRKSLPCGLQIYSSKIGLLIAGSFQTAVGIPKEATPKLSMLVGTPQHTAKLVESLHDLDALGISDTQRDENDEEVFNNFNKTAKLIDGRYEIELPWKCPKPSLPNNYYLARKRLESAIKSLNKDPKRFAVCQEIIDYQLKNKIIEEIPDDEILTSSNLVHYFPHRPVFKETPEQIKVRIVYDASAKTRNSVSLNECLFRGPVILRSLFGIFIRIRNYRYLICADIEKAFLQISIQPKDRDVLRFLWIKDINKPLEPSNIRSFRFCRVPFGVISSPALLAMTIKLHVDKSETWLSTEMLENLYVDNIFFQANTPEEVEAKSKEAIKVFQSASMKLHEFVSNDQSLAGKLPKDFTLASPNQKLLGIRWNTQTDQLSFNFPKAPSEPITRRKVLETIASLFDPAGLITPTVIKARALFQRLWKENQKWDDNLKTEDLNHWNKFIATWNECKSLSLPRMTQHAEENSNQSYELHVFADASKMAYGAAAYLVSIGTKTSSYLIASKGRVTPQVRSFTIPELELIATLTATRLASTLKEELHLPISKVIIWSDSEAVIKWLKSGKTNQTSFVKNRLSSIYDSQFKNFRHIEGIQNPADLVSRGMNPTELQLNALWWHGPEFLCKSPIDWPKSLIADLNEHFPEQEISTSMTSIPHSKPTQENWIFGNQTSWPKLIRIVQTVMFFASLFKRRCKKNVNPKVERDKIFVGSEKPKLPKPDLSNFEREKAKFLIIKENQRCFLPDEQEICNLRIQSDINGILRCHGRIDKSELPFETANPIFLHRKSPLAQIVIMFYHETNQHSNTSTTLCEVRQKFWVPQGRRTVGSVIKKNCFKCRPFNALPFKQPDFPQLPANRICSAVPFKSTGFDYFGPIAVKQSKDTSKVYCAVFTCMVTRAVHIEVAKDRTTAQVIACFHRFIARRGLPESMLSDNACEFVAAAQILENLYSPTEPFKWSLITPLAPWRGGFYERMNSLIKHCLRRTIGRQKFTLSTLETLITQIESVVNNRPLTQPSDSFDESFKIIRPVDFLRPLHSSIDSIPPSFIDDPSDPTYTPKRNLQDELSDALQLLASQIDKFWHLWSNEYLLSLRERQRALQKQNAITRSPVVGEVVLLHETETERNNWPIAVVSQILPSNDETTRTIRLKTPKGKILTRAINHIFPLEISYENSSTANCSPSISALTNIMSRNRSRSPLREQHSSARSRRSDNHDRPKIKQTPTDYELRTDPAVFWLDWDLTSNLGPLAACKHRDCEPITVQTIIDVEGKLAAKKVYSLAKIILLIGAQRNVKDPKRYHDYVDHVLKLSTSQLADELFSGHKFAFSGKFISSTDIREAYSFWTAHCHQAYLSFHAARYLSFHAPTTTQRIGSTPALRLFADAAQQFKLQRFFPKAKVVTAKQSFFGDLLVPDFVRQLGSTFQRNYDNLAVICMDIKQYFFGRSAQIVIISIRKSFIASLDTDEITSAIGTIQDRLSKFKQLTILWWNELEPNDPKLDSNAINSMCSDWDNDSYKYRWINTYKKGPTALTDILSHYHVSIKPAM